MYVSVYSYLHEYSHEYAFACLCEEGRGQLQVSFLMSYPPGLLTQILLPRNEAGRLLWCGRPASPEDLPSPCPQCWGYKCISAWLFYTASVART